MRNISSFAFLGILLASSSFFSFSITAHAKSKETKTDYASYVNPFIGATTNVDDAGVYHGLGKTFPGATVPFGMVQISPNTITRGDNGSGYSYEHTSIEGFALTQMSGIGWNGDLGNFLVMPTVGDMKKVAGSPENTSEGYRSNYSKESETAEAGYYSVFLDDYNVKTELSSTERCGVYRFTYPKNTQSRIQIDLARRVGGTSTLQYIRIIDEYTIEGWMQCPPEGGGWGNSLGNSDYTVYFYAQFSKPLKDYGVWSAGIPDGQKRLLEDVTSEGYLQIVKDAKEIPMIDEIWGRHLGFYSNFETKENEEVELKVGISFVSMNGAKKNFEAEVRNKNFEEVKQLAHDNWNKALGKIEVEGGTLDQKTVFYTAMYHTMIDPRTFEDVDGKCIGGDKEVHESPNFTKRTIFSGWDVFRSQFPLQTIINPEVVNDMINSLSALADQSGRGYFERWELMNAYSGCMIGNPAISVLTDAYAKGIRNYDIDKAYSIAKATCELSGNEKLGFNIKSNPENSGFAGFAVNDFSISNTLEYSYTEWCFAQMAKSLGKDADYNKYMKLSQSYRNVFDKEMNWFRAKNEDGTWKEWPKEGRLQEWFGTVECNPYQQGWFVPHDVDGMVELMGGKDKALPDLVEFFDKAPENMMWNMYYNHANEPVHHVPFLFNRMGESWLTQKWTRLICDRAYKNKVEGLVGNEDVGQMSAWYVLASIGIYQVCPGDNIFDITSPLFDKITIHLNDKYASGKTFEIITNKNSAKNTYIKSAKFNGKTYSKNHLMFDDIKAGGKLELEMTSKPNKKWGETHK